MWRKVISVQYVEFLEKGLYSAYHRSMQCSEIQDQDTYYMRGLFDERP